VLQSAMFNRNLDNEHKKSRTFEEIWHANYNRNKIHNHFREKNDLIIRILLIKESRLFIEDARIFYISYAEWRRDVADDNSHA